MKNKILFLLSVFFLISACASTESSASNVETAVAISDPCSTQQLPTQAVPITDLLISFDDTSFVATHTPPEQLAVPIMQLQSLRRQLTKLEVPYCIVKIKQYALDYMNSVIIYMTYSMGGGENEQINEGIQTCQQIRNILDSEYQNLLGIAYLPPQTTIPDTGALIATAQMTPQIEATITVKNESEEAVNIRSLPDLNSTIIGSMKSGEILIGFSKDTSNQWVMVEFHGKTGWVNASVVRLNYSLNILPVVPSEDTELKND